jgi:leader peptidase (prepilin peptidase) / N-methyltransferase
MYIILFFILGAIFGSFLNCMIYRIHKEKSILGRSFCLSCNKTLEFLDLIPIFSYIFLRGKCRYCKSKFSIEHFLVEFISGSLFAFGYWFFFSSGFWAYENLITSYAFYLLLTFLLSFIFIYDLKYYLIVDVVVYVGIFLSIVFNVIIGKNIFSILYGVILGLCFFGVQYLISKGRWLGSGDILLGVLMGSLLGFKITIVALMICYFVGSIIGVFFLTLKKKKMDSRIPLGPFIAFATLVCFLFGEQLVNWYFNLIIL